MYSVARPLYINNDGMMYKAVNDSGSGDRVTEIVSELFEVNVSSNNGRVFTVSSVDDLEE